MISFCSVYMLREMQNVNLKTTNLSRIWEFSIQTLASHHLKDIFLDLNDPALIILSSP